MDKPSGTITATRCNCTLCQKLSTVNLRLDGPADFTLLAPASQDDIKQYSADVKTLSRYYCDKCGCHVWMEGYLEFNGHKAEVFAINLGTVDQPQGDVDLSKTKMRYFDMLHDNIAGGAADKPWACGLP
jgi:hypothetical protein